MKNTFLSIIFLLGVALTANSQTLIAKGTKTNIPNSNSFTNIDDATIRGFQNIVVAINIAEQGWDFEAEVYGWVGTGEPRQYFLGKLEGKKDSDSTRNASGTLTLNAPLPERLFIKVWAKGKSGTTQTATVNWAVWGIAVNSAQATTSQCSKYAVLHFLLREAANGQTELNKYGADGYMVVDVQTVPVAETSTDRTRTGFLYTLRKLIPCT